MTIICYNPLYIRSPPQNPSACLANNCFTSSWSLHSTTDVFAESNASDLNCILILLIFLQENYHVWKDAIHALMKLSLPLTSCMTMFFVFWWSRGNRVRIMRWSNIFKIQWLYLYYSFNISFIYHSIDWQYLQDPFNMSFKYNAMHLQCFICNLIYL